MVCDLGRVARSSWIAGIKVEPLISCWVASGISWDFMGFHGKIIYKWRFSSLGIYLRVYKRTWLAGDLTEDF
jgi:hypothetical protein